MQRRLIVSVLCCPDFGILFFACRKDKLVGRSRYVFVYLLLPSQNILRRLCFDRCVFIYLFICEYVCLFVIRITPKVLNSEHFGISCMQIGYKLTALW